ncbi:MULTISPECIES: hypothetical protein [Myxococcus]|uniref:hypothetical protein n=1 Tax=Myxococcus TaxID=32 RepID=UPI001E53DE14|nr:MULTISPECIES: hypothetical protein [Myxococcus]MCK8499892.1 hypothetical protein [Myxococcus fulvus]
MNFIHDDSDFDDLLRIVAKDRGLSVALVEKDYWVTHTLWALHATGFQVWFSSARVTPFVHRDMTSFVHEALEARGQLGDYDDNRPKAVRCVHPLVTLLEKLDALQRRALHDEKEPASFVRHYEDAARIIEAESRLPMLPDYPSVHALASEMVAQKQIIEPPRPDAPALQLPPCKRTDDIRAAHEAIGRMFWGSRKTLDEALETIRAWLEHTGLGAASPDGL